MRYFLAVLITFSSVNVSYGQLTLKQKRIDYTQQSVTEFIKNNNFEYALVAWSGSNWIIPQNEFSALLKQNGKWYLAKLLSPSYPMPPKKYDTLAVNQVLLQARQLDSILRILKPDSAFKYKQADLNKLHGKCQYSIMDAGTDYLMQYSNHKFAYLTYDAPGFYLKSCYPAVKEFGMLRGLDNTCNTLWLAAPKETKLHSQSH